MEISASLTACVASLTVSPRSTYAAPGARSIAPKSRAEVLKCAHGRKCLLAAWWGDQLEARSLPRGSRCHHAVNPTVALGGLELGIGAAVLFLGSIAGLALMKSSEKLAELSGANKPQCPTCKGTGTCVSCDGTGFIARINEEEANKARNKATDYSKKYTAGLPKKWKYCLDCKGERLCSTCLGRGWVEPGASSGPGATN